MRVGPEIGRPFNGFWREPKAKNGMRECTQCKITKPVIAFRPHSQKPHTQLSICRECEKIVRRRQYWENPERYRRNSRIWKLKAYYGMSWEQFCAFVESHGDKCAICDTTLHALKNTKKYAIDHDHRTGRVRALLCHQCNPGLGSFRDSPELLERAAAYLRKHRGGE